ncbi:hypothetical protein NDU88_004577 [Pleurodeles waltl]|uniref:Uncharacterized protein n=1 Tax=Pleurodeles waltl TaxID=8319 RepID=A0AAV7WAS1_PLEWA|nr:hypothetical protein NDU88_004577 [Pleurodeles waltl]
MLMCSGGAALDGRSSIGVRAPPVRHSSLISTEGNGRVKRFVSWNMQDYKVVSMVNADNKASTTSKDKESKDIRSKYYHCGNLGHAANSLNCYARNSVGNVEKSNYMQVCKGDKLLNVDLVADNMNKMVFSIKPGINQIEESVRAMNEGPITMPECSIKLDNKDIKVVADSQFPYTMMGDKI